jgi:gentisate 1,2-dioxygenase
LVLESEAGVATVVDGVELPIRPSEVLLTPGGTWHSHFNSGEANSYWIDFLDVPLVQQLEPMFFDPYPAEFQRTEQRPASHNFLIERACIDRGLTAASPSTDDVRTFDISSSAIPTLQLSVIEFSTDGASLNVQETSNSVYAVMSGEGEFLTEKLSADWSFGDVLSSPMWTRTLLRGRAGARLLRVSDQPVMEKLGFYKTIR